MAPLKALKRFRETEAGGVSGAGVAWKITP
jgi:hypothetical protein